MRIAALSLIAVAAFAPGSATAQSQPVPRADYLSIMDGEFRKMDADRDGMVTKAEIERWLGESAAALAQQRSAAAFRQLDTDRNGQLSPAEFARLPANAAPVNAAPVLAQGDLNRDGRISLVEFRTGKLASFDRMDTDKDGIVSVAEMRAAGIAK